MPGWLKRKHGYEIWNRANLWILAPALTPERLTVMALWDGKDTGDGPEDTSDLLTKAEGVNATPDVIRTNVLCSL